MFIIAAQFYWLVWLLFKYYGYSHIGMLAGVLVVISLWSITSRIQFKTWKFWV